MNHQLILTLLFRHREALLLLLGVPIAIWAMRGSGLAHWSALLGALTAAGGVALRLVAIRRIGRGARVYRAHASAGLIASGPYRWSRNPLYLAAALMLCGLGLIAGGGWMAAALFPVSLIAYSPVVLAEERALATLLGDSYRGYCARVPRWLGVPASPEAPPGPLVTWSEVFRREKSLVPGMMAASLAIAAVCAQWIPTRALTDPLERISGVELDTWILGAAAAIAIGNAVKVEIHQRQRRASRAARAARTTTAP